MCDGQLRHPNLFPISRAGDRSHLSSYQVFDVGPDGAPLSIDVDEEEEEGAQSKEALFWNTVKVCGSFHVPHSFEQSWRAKFMQFQVGELRSSPGGTSLGFERSSDESAHHPDHILGMMNVSNPH